MAVISVATEAGMRFKITPRKVGDANVEVLKDTRCSTVVAHANLVRAEVVTGAMIQVRLGDGTVRNFPIAVIEVQPWYLDGFAKAVCL